MRDPKSEVAAAVLVLLARKTPVEKMLAVLTEFSHYTPETLGAHLCPEGLPTEMVGETRQNAFVSGPDSYNERLLEEWYSWLLKLANWKTQDLTETEVQQLFKRLHHPDASTRRFVEAHRRYN